jgi:hypothetical protein
MSDIIWYVYQQSQQQGPFGTEQVKKMIDTKMISQDAYLFKVGWKDWRPVEDTYEELGLKGDSGTSEEASVARRAGAPRASIQGRVIVHNNGQLIIGSGVNISSTGIFVETKDQIFTIGERLKLSVKAEGIARPFNAVALVIRFNSDSKYSIGYGLQFENLDQVVKKEIASLVDLQNTKQKSKDAASH